MSIRRVPSVICRATLVVLRWGHFMPVVVGLGLLARLWWVFTIDAAPVFDALWFYDRGADIALGRGYVHNGSPTAYWPVGYAGFLGALFALAGPSLALARLVNVALSLATLWLSWHFVRTTFRSDDAARVTAALLSVYPNHIAYTSTTMSETFGLLLLMLGSVSMVAALRRGVVPALAAGLVFAAATLTKPQVILVPAIIAAAWAARPSSVRRSALVAAIVYCTLLATLAPWVARNYRVFGGFVLVSTNGGINLLIGNNAGASGTYEWGPRYEAMLDGAEGEYARDAKATSLAVSYVRRHPIETVRAWPGKLYALYGTDLDGLSWNTAGLPASRRVIFTFGGAKAAGPPVYALIALLGVCGVLFVRKPDPFQWVGVLVVLYFTFVHLLFFAGSRFHFQNIPWMAMYAGVAVDRLLAWGVRQGPPR